MCTAFGGGEIGPEGGGPRLSTNRYRRTTSRRATGTGHREFRDQCLTACETRYSGFDNASKGQACGGGLQGNSTGRPSERGPDRHTRDRTLIGPVCELDEKRAACAPNS